MSLAVLDVLIPAQLPSGGGYHDLLQSLCKYPSLVPDNYDAAEPVRESFDKRNLDQIAETVRRWGKGFIWKRRKPKAWGAFYPNFSPKPAHARIHFEASVGSGIEESDVIGLLKDWSYAFGADFGFLEARPSKPDPTRPSLFAHTRDLVRGVPQLFWATIFGPPYIELYGRDRLRSTPAAVTIELGPNLFYVQLTDRISDTIECPEIVDEARQKAKEHLGIDTFVLSKEAANASRLPVFSFVSPQPTP